MVVHTVIPAIRRLKLENQKFEASLGYIARLCLRKQNKTNTDRWKIGEKMTINSGSSIYD
jgi:hypothetical protein